ncbi:MAG TPA: glucose-6-phosphate isomerase [Candidatus Eisenbacteria bacterium]|nr:glucose-6-phosphate isomerase [Candidatus Eisenbacteria bacterium]
MPKGSSIAYDHAFMWSSSASAGTADGEREALAKSLGPVKAKLLDDWKSGRVGFFAIPELKSDLAELKRAAADVSRKFDDLIVVGIGGSDLGARALIRALGRGKGMRVHFIGANTDPDEIAALLDRVDLRKAAINIISKSGDTIEPMSAFVLLRDRLVRRVGLARHRKHVIATTDPKSGTLRQIADKEGYRTLPVPQKIGGRFSALTTVGLFPAACAGIDAAALVAGCRAERDAFAKSAPGAAGPLLFAGLHHDAYVRRGQRISVLMPYADGLKEFGSWFRQLWAESLGKKKSRSGMTVHHGMTPVAALGATDQHSQVQLYNEGPTDKIVTFIEVDGFRKDFAVPNPYPDLEGTAYMAGRKFSEIIHAERAATALALARNGRPSGTLHVPAVTEASVGALMCFFMIATAAAAELLDIDAYDQPGVEEGKKAMYAMLGRKGYTL